MKKKKKKNPIKTTLTTLFLTLILMLAFWVADSLVTVRLPQSNQPTELYSNQVRDDLRKTLTTSIGNAKKSVLLIIYSLTDPSVISALKEKSKEGVEVTVICDAQASPQAAKRLGPTVTTRKRFSKGLMHQKILVVDGVHVWIGSANMTSESLRVHGNLLAAFDSHEVAHMVHNSTVDMFSRKASIHPRTGSFDVGGQNMELWLLPHNFSAVQKLIKLIQSAKKTIRVAMFTWTRHDLAQAIIAAHNRGVDTQVVIDHYSGHGASAKVVKLLKQGGVPISLSQGNALLHHKFLYIDGETLVNGSANWTKAAFTKNDDCFIVLHKLTDPQKQRMEHLWEVISSEAQ